jgi:hypothetical protein
MYSILNGLLTRKSPRPAHAKTTRRQLVLENLEERVNPVTIPVTNADDAGPGSLRQAIIDSNASVGVADDIVFDAAFFSTAKTITLASALPVVSDSVNFVGTSAKNVIIDGGGAFRPFDVNGTGTLAVAFKNLTIQNGFVTSATNAGGSAIRNQDETLTLDSVRILTNKADNIAVGAVYNKGAGNLTIANSELSGNLSGKSSFSGTGAAIYFYNGGILTLNNSTLSGNSGNGEGGAIYSFNATLTINNSTITANTGATGGGIFSTTAITLNSSIVALNIDTAAIAADIKAPSTADTNSFIGDVTGSGATGTPLTGDPLFDVAGLAFNGGNTRTFALQATSTAKDAGNNSKGFAFDQRGTPFARTSGTATDIGAFEIQIAAAPIITSTSPLPSAVVGIPYSVTLTANATPAPTWSITGTLPAGLVLDPVSGVISGTPTTAGTSNFSVIATNANGTDTDPFALTVIPFDTVVSNANDSGGGSLRQAILNANFQAGPNTVTFDAAFFSSAKTITLASALPTISEAVTITGPGANLATVNGGGLGSIFVIDDKLATFADISVSKLTLTNGKAGSGGAINSLENLTLSEVVVSGNTANNGGGVYVSSGANLTISKSTVSGNSTNTGGFGGGLYFIGAGTLTISDSTFSGNSSTNRGGGAVLSGKAIITGSTFSANVSSAGAALQIFNGTSDVTITNSTFANNKANDPTAIADGGAIRWGAGKLAISNSTFAGNEANTGKDGGAIVIAGTGLTLDLTSSIFATNLGTTAPDIFLPATSTGVTINANNTLIGVADGLTLTGSNNLTGTTGTPLDPLFDVAGLTNNGGLTQTIGLQATSPAKNTGSNPLGLFTDQRGGAFSRNSGGNPDIGAFEIQVAAPPAFNNGPAPTATEAVAYSFALSVSGSPTPTLTQTGTLPPGVTFNATTGVFSGTPTATGTFTGTITATNSGGSATFNYSITVIPFSTVVLNSNDAGTGSLRQAIINSNSKAGTDPITFDATFFSSTKTIKLASALPVITDSTSLTGTDAKNVVIDGDGLFRVFDVNGTGILTVDFKNLTIQNGFVTSAANDGGSAIRNQDEIINLNTVRIVNNKSDNVAVGAIYNKGAGELNIVNSEISGNLSGKATFGGGGAGIYFFAGGTFNLTNSTVSGNTTAGKGGGIYLFGTVAKISNSTIALNSGGDGGGIFSNNAFDLVSSIVAKNTTSGTGVDISGTVNDTKSFIGDLTGATPSGTPLTGDPLFDGAGLAFNGGSTQTLGLQAGSPALNVGSNPLGLTTDQRGGTFSRNSQTGVDIGAFEFQVLGPPVFNNGPLTDAGENLPYTFVLDVSGTPTPVLAQTGTLPTGITFDPVTGTFSGTPTQTGTFTGTITATNSQGTATFNYSLVVTPFSLVVTNTNDSGTGSLRLAVAFANNNPGADPITFDPVVFSTPQTITLTSGGITISDSTTIDGKGLVTIDGNAGVDMFTIDDGIFGTAIDVDLSGLILQNVGGAGVNGSVIFIQDEDVTLSKVTVQNNQAAGNGVIFIGAGKLTVSQSLITGNTVGAGGGGIFTSTGDVTIDSTTLSNNIATGAGGAINIGGGTLTLSNSTISGNTSTAGGGIFSYGGTVDVVNSTIANNSATTYYGGGIFNNGGGATTISNSTITGNSAGKSGGGVSATGTLDIVSSIIALNTATISNPDIETDPVGTPLNANTSIIGVADGLTINGAGNLTGTAGTPLDPLFNPAGLADNGGPTQTIALLDASPAKNVGSNPLGLLTDQRGVGFARDDGNGVDIGAFEILPAVAPTITSANSTTFLVGTLGTFTVTANGIPNTFTFSATNLPTGITLDPTTGVLSGTPTAGQGGVINTIVITVSNGTLPDATQNFTLTINEAPAITSATPPTTGTTGVTYGPFTVTATGFPTPTFSATGLPTGITINTTTGVLSGTPTVGGSFNVVITATNGILPDASQSFTLDITATSAPTITSADNAVFVVGTAGTFTVTATGVPAPTFSATNLPTGITINTTTGVISGTPTVGQGGTYATIVITATNGINPADTQNFTLTINEAPTITTAPPTGTGTVGTAYTFDVDATGFPAPTFSATGLPAGLSIDPTTGVISGTPTTVEVANVVITASNGIGADATQTVTITVGPANVAPTITSATPPTTGTVGSAYGPFTVTATGTPAPTFSATGLPTGITIDATSGVLSGMPTASGSFNVVITATNGVTPDATQSFTLDVVAAPAAPTITSTAPTTGVVNVAFSYQVTATGNPATFTFSATGLPAGLSINPTTGLVSGTPTTAGASNVVITVSNGVTPDATQAFALTIAATGTAPTLTSLGSPPAATVNTPYSFTPFAVTGTPTPSFSATGLPAGLTIDPTSGLISGTPTTAGSFTATITAANGIAPDASQSLTLVVNPANTGTAPTITSSPISTARVGRVVNFPVTATGDTPITFSATGLPTGLTINAATGVISGDPTVFGTFTGSVTATNATGTVSQNFTLVVARFFDPGFEITNVSGPPSGASSSFTFDAKTFQTVAVTGKANFTPFPGAGAGDVRSTSADVDGDGIADFIYATGPNVGTGDQLRVVSGATGKDLLTAGTFSAYAGENFTTIGMFVVSADIDGDGKAEIVVSPDQGGGARIQIFKLQGGTLVQAANFFGIEDPAFRGGGRIALGDVNGDGFQEVIVGAGFGGGPRIAVFNGKGLASFGSAGSPPKLLGDFIVFNPGAELLRNGTWVTAGDVNGDGFADLVFGAGPGGGPRVTIFDGKTLVTNGSAAADAKPLANFFGGDVNQRGGIRVSLKDVDADRLLDLVVGSGEGFQTGVTTYLSKNLPASGQGTPAVNQVFDPFGISNLANGIYVG